MYMAQITEMTGLYENSNLNVYEFIDFPRSQKSSPDLSYHFEQSSTTFL